jgi:hypothetical protein
VRTANVAEVAPAGTVTVAGTAAEAAALLVRVTTAPPAGAGSRSVTVPTAATPPVTRPGCSVTETGSAGSTVRVAQRTTPAKRAATATGVAARVRLVSTENVAVVSFGAIRTHGGTRAAGLSLVSATSSPPAGAGSVRVTVPMAVRPPITRSGARRISRRPTGSIVRVALSVSPS